ncbi:hypothetical protein [Inhella sp.]|uniref:hypothetical protein n=1 Tax=Inhella sp. TaxID=1921806 RepID=UPI0035AE77FE
MHTPLPRLGALLALLLAMRAPAWAEAPVPVHVLESMRAPDGQGAVLNGPLLLQRARQAFDAAGLSVRLEFMPLRRSLHELQANRTAFCLLGAFYTPERAGFGRYSKALVREEQQVLIGPPAVMAQLAERPDAQAALQDSRFELLSFEGVSYGPELDRWIAGRARPAQLVSAGTARALPMLARGRADFMISTRSELALMLQRQGYGPGEFTALQPPGMPEPPSRHLLCSLKVEPAWVARFDAALPELPLQGAAPN